MVRKHGVDSLAKGYCIFCQTDKDDTDKLGQMYTSDGMTVHYFCMLFASGLSQNGKSEEDGIMGFLPADIMKEVRRAMRLRCIYCKRIGATVGCVMSRCRAVFHMPCGLQNGALNQFMGEFRSYCATHRPQQNMPPSNQVSSSSTVCIICMNKVAMHPSNTVLYTPCCRSSWFHRDCLQHHAISSGLHFFRCPLCNDKDLFQNEMLKFGIYIPDQDAAWEREPNAFQDLLIRYGQCDVNCKCPHGRKYEKKSSKWDIVLCDWCGSSGTHLACSNLKSALDDWICEECYKICGNDQTKKKKKTTNSVKRRKWTEARSYVHSVTQKSLHARHRNTSVGCRLRKRMRSDRQVSDGGWSTSSDCQVCACAEDTEAETSRVSGLRAPQMYTSPVAYTHHSQQYSVRGDAESRPFGGCTFFSRPSVDDLFPEESPTIACQSVVENECSQEDSHQTKHLSFLRGAAAECESTSSLQKKTIPRWYRSLMSEDILTGKNLGTKYMKQYQDISFVFQTAS